MGTTERRQREREAKRERILAAARHLFTHEGFENVTLRRIAERVEYSPGSLYSYFKDKDDLLWELCQDGFDRLTHLMLNAMQAAAGAPEHAAAKPDALGQLHAIGHAYIQFALRYPEDFHLMFNTRNMNEAFRERITAQMRQQDAQQHSYLLLRALVQRCMDEGCLRAGDADTVAITFWSLVHGLVSLHLTGKLSMMAPDHYTPAHLTESLDYLMASLAHPH